MLRGRLLASIRSRMAADPPSLRLVFPDGERFDFATPAAVTLTIHQASVLRALALGNMTRLGDAYVRGELTVEGAVRDVLHVGLTLSRHIGRLRLVNRLAPLLAALPFRHGRRRDAAAISHHYDVSNDFYALWLDRRMIYSCGYFPTGREGIDEAQERKLDHLCRKLRLQPGERLLDIGCGWGGLLIWAAHRYGVTGVGITLSREQHRYACERILAEGLGDRVTILLGDYRDLRDHDLYDKIVSVGMYEHVGLRNLGLYFGTVNKLLKPGGIALNHGITAGDPKGQSTGPAGGDFIDRYVFPGGEIPHLSRAIYEVARAGLEVVDVEDLRPHYARTLQLWVDRFEQHAAAAEAAVGHERYRVWRLYMAGMGYAFDQGWLRVAQILAYKPPPDGMAPRPWTRDYQYAPDAPSSLCDASWAQVDRSVVLRTLDPD